MHNRQSEFIRHGLCKTSANFNCALSGTKPSDDMRKNRIWCEEQFGVLDLKSSQIDWGSVEHREGENNKSWNGHQHMFGYRF